MVLSFIYIDLYEVDLATVAAKRWNFQKLSLLLVNKIYEALTFVTSHPEKRIFAWHVYKAGISAFIFLRYESMMHSGLGIREVTGFLAL